MRAEVNDYIIKIKQSIGLLRRHLDWDKALARLEELNRAAEDPALWNDPEQAQAKMQERTRLENAIQICVRLQSEMDDHVDMIDMGEAEGDADIVTESETALAALQARAESMEVETLLSGEADTNDVYLEVHAGAGGTESQDWASMMLRMYLRWAEKKGYKATIIEQTDGEEAGIKSATLEISGHNAYGWAKTESGVHRLVRISPFDSNARRHTSFASVWCYPVVDDTIAIDVAESDVRIDTFRASGAGGQHVNTTDSAVRITHLETNIVVQCQNQRSQHKNRATAWAMLRARLYELELQKREEEAMANAEKKTEIGWGHQIRSYVLQPYQMVKDLRTGVESGNPSAVLDGALDPFMEAALAQRVNGDAGDASSQSDAKD
ncbi:peptide chain release factor 2 [Alphaproteobacteria bacterium]|nr:peptide chain release factor 2 [bacterium]MDC0131901.1 peptide chain release factor 2 [Alphaproteobacteria bacterium]MDC0147475.1 peptide chain release factor 2 [Alphaproteobacteria bacterium]